MRQDAGLSMCENSPGLKADYLLLILGFDIYQKQRPLLREQCIELLW